MTLSDHTASFFFENPMFYHFQTHSIFTRPRSLVKGVVLYAMSLVAGLAVASASAVGQNPMGQDYLFTLPDGTQIPMRLATPERPPVTDLAQAHMPVLAQARIVVDKTTHVATVEIENRTKDTLTIALRMDRLAPLNQAAPLHTDTIPEAWSLTDWVKDLPATIQLAPHAKRKLQVHVDVPNDAKSGLYSGWVIAKTTQFRGQNAGTPSGAADSASGTTSAPTLTEAGSRIVYGSVTDVSK